MKNKLLLLTILISCLIFFPSIGNFFSADDWFHLRVSDAHSIGEFINFFSFFKTPQAISFYRPISTQLFFFVFHHLFGLQSSYYYIFVLLIFALSLYLFYLVAKKITSSQKISLLAVFFYGISSTNFTKIYFLSAFQEILMVVFVLSSILSYLKDSSKKSTAISIFFFILALGSKETAVVLVPILFILDWARNKSINLKRTIPYILILLPYLFLRFYFFGNAVGDSYIWDFSPLKAVNTLMWYLIWSLGAPEGFLNYVSRGLRVVPGFYTDFPLYSRLIVFSLLSTLLFLVLLTLKNILKFNRNWILYIGIFLLSLAPVIFLPWHKFAHELGLPMIGVSLFLATLSNKKSSIFILFSFSFLILNISSNLFNLETHYVVSRSKTARQVLTYFQKKYLEFPVNNYFEFIGKKDSKQIAYAIYYSDMLRVAYKDPKIEIYFEGVPGKRPNGKKRIILFSNHIAF